MLPIPSHGDLHLQEWEEADPFLHNRWLPPAQPHPTISMQTLHLGREAPTSVTSGQGWEGQELQCCWG